MYRLIALLISVISVAGCDHTYFINPSDTSSQTVVSNNGGTTTSFKDRIEYRVTGNLGTATIRYGNTLDGTTQLVTTLPFSSTLEVNAPFVFVSLDVSANGLFFTGNPFLLAQIFVNGVIFREDSSVSSSPVLSISGTFRH